MRKAVALVVFVAAAGAAGLSMAQTEPLKNPQKHFKIKDPANLSKDEAIRAYKSAREKMARGYARSTYSAGADFAKWPKFNTAPYLSATHGNRYINNYANAKVGEYGDPKNQLVMPPGAILAKDSFTVTADGSVFPGALFIMEKLKPGVHPKTGDWRYLMVLPDGSMFGDTLNPQGGDMAFCHSCHHLRKKSDYLFGIPAEYRK
jgi:hypothetical protein